MIKQIITLSAISFLGACSTYSNSMIGNNDCNVTTPVEINESATKEYREVRANGMMKSAFIDIIGKDVCEDEVCTRFHPARYDFIERQFNDDKRQGIYTLKATKDLKDPNCFGVPEDIDGTKYCYSLTKNQNNEIKSRYKFTMINQDTYRVMKIDDLKNKEQVIKFSECNIKKEQKKTGLKFL